MVLPDGFSLKDGYASFRPTGAATVETLLASLEQALKACHEQKVTRLHVNITALHHPPLVTADWYRWGTGLASIWDRDVRLAVVGREDQIDKDRFGTLVARNRGLVYGIHTSDEAALQWLLQGG